MPTLAREYCRAILTPAPLEDVRSQHSIALRRALDRPALLDGFQCEQDSIASSKELRDIVGFLKMGNLHDRNSTLVHSVLPYTEVDEYGQELEKLADIMNALIRHIDTHSAMLGAYSLVSGGRVLHASDLRAAKVHLAYETK